MYKTLLKAVRTNLFDVLLNFFLLFWKFTAVFAKVELHFFLAPQVHNPKSVTLFPLQTVSTSSRILFCFIYFQFLFFSSFCKEIEPRVILHFNFSRQFSQFSHFLTFRKERYSLIFESFPVLFFQFVRKFHFTTQHSFKTYICLIENNFFSWFCIH